MQDWDYLDYLSLLSPKGSLGGGGRVGLPRVTREDVLAALAGIDPLAELLVYARLGMLSAAELADKSVHGAFVIAVETWRVEMRAFSLDDFTVAWRVACAVDALSEDARSDRSLMRFAGVSNAKWSRIRPAYQLSGVLIAGRWDSVRFSISKVAARRVAA